jgi:hypothetical protein
VCGGSEHGVCVCKVGGSVCGGGGREGGGERERGWEEKKRGWEPLFFFIISAVKSRLPTAAIERNNAALYYCRMGLKDSIK